MSDVSPRVTAVEAVSATATKDPRLQKGVPSGEITSWARAFVSRWRPVACKR
jgi:hypothetical protein